MTAFFIAENQKEEIMEPIILASSSPRRQDILKMLKIPFRVIIPNVDETLTSAIEIEEIPELLAREKVSAVIHSLPSYQEIPWVLGADTVIVRKLFASTMDSYQRKSRIVAAAQIYKGCAVAESEFSSDDMRIIAPQAADELLSIQGVEASFVLYPENGGVSISARSLGKVNVQLIMVSLGGGGHQTMAAAQLPSLTLQETKERLLQALEAYEAEQKHH